MGFVKSLEEIAESQRVTAEFYGAEALIVYFFTKPEIVQKLLPPPLKPAAMPLGSVFLAHYPRTNFGVTYRESALLLAADFKGETGLYCLSMPVTNDIALILGRETFGYPKKMADIHLTRQGSKVEGWTERHGVRLLDVRVNLTGTFNDKAALGMMKDRLQANPDTIIFNFKYFQSPTRKGFDYNPRLVRGVVKSSEDSLEFGEAEFVLRSSDHDPWGEIEIAKVLGATYTVGSLTMLPGAVVAEVDQGEFAPYAFMKIDALPAAVGQKK
jgi:acetoacetate decarboxylase